MESKRQGIATKAATKAAATRRGPLALGGLLVSISALALVGVVAMSPVGGVEGTLATPGHALGALTGPDGTIVPSPSAQPDAAGPSAGVAGEPAPSHAPAQPTATNSITNNQGQTGPEPAKPSSADEADPTPRRTARPTARPPTPGPTTPPPTNGPLPTVVPNPTPDPPPTPGPTPTPPPPTPTPQATPEPTPQPTPDCQVVPALAGMTIADARQAWRDARFTGSFTPAAGLNTKIVESQSQAAGSCIPAEGSIVVTYD